MINLWKANIFKVRKDVLTYVCLGLCLLMSLGNGVMGIFFDVIVDVPEAKEMLEGMYTGRTLFISTLSPVNNMGFMIPIFLYIIMNRDYNTGAIRQKVIGGYSRTKIYLSSYLVTLVCGLVFQLFNMVCSLVFGTLFFGYGSKWGAEELGLLLKAGGLGLIVYALFLTIAHFYMHTLKNIGYVAYIGTLFVIGGLSALSMLETKNGFVKFLVDWNPINQISVISAFVFDSRTVITTLASSFVFMAALAAGGLYLFKKTDLK